MLIGIDGNEANIDKRVGVGQYANELLGKLKAIKSFYNFQIYLKNKPLLDLPPEAENWHYRIVGPSQLWTQFGLPLNLYWQKPKPDVFFTPSHYAPRFCPCPRVISIMDLSYIHFPEMFRREDLWQLKNWTGYSIKKATRILTISQSSKNDIIKYYQVQAEKVVVTYPGYRISLNSKMTSAKSVIKKYGIKGDYILSVGTLQPRKNFVRLIEAFSKLELPHELVIVGKQGWLWEEIYEAPKKFGIEEKVKFLNYVSDEDLSAIYQNASCFVLVSLYEGFGIPVLEAMNYGCPVVASNISSLPEVVKDAGILVDPYDIEEIAHGIKEALAQREMLVKKGFRQCHQFSWEKCARQTLKVLEEAGGR